MIPNKDKSLIVFVVVGRLGKSLTESKVSPIMNSSKVKKVYIFREEIGYNIEGAEYIVLPELLKKIKIRLVKKILRIMYELIQLLYYAIKLKPDYINGIYTLPKGFNSLVVSKISGCKSIISVIGGEREVLTYLKPTIFWKNVNLRMLRNCDVVTTKGMSVKRYLIDNGIIKDKIFVFNGSIDIKKYYSVGNNLDKDIDILFVGTFRKLKGPDRVLDIVSNLRDNFPEIKAYFLGNGDLFDLIQREIATHKLENNVILTGYVDDTEQYFKRAKMLIMPSKGEGLSTAMLEAMACGCVPVVSDVGNMTDAAKHNVNSFVVNDYRDIDTFAKYAHILLKDKVKWEYMANNAIKTVTHRYSVFPQTQTVENIIKYGENA